jgi:hypothetical protein
MKIIPEFKPSKFDPNAQVESNVIAEHYKKICEDLAMQIEQQDKKASLSFLHRMPICKKCNGKIYKHDKKPVSKITTLHGIITPKLQRFRCAGCKKIYVPGKCHLPHNNISANMLEFIIFSLSKMSFKDVSYTLKKFYKIALSPSKLHGILKNEGIVMVDLVEQNTAELFIEHQEIEEVVLPEDTPLLIGIDGGFVRKWKQKGKSSEVKAITIATGTEHVSGDRYKLTDRKGYAANIGVEEFSERAYTFALQNGLKTASNVVIVSDGAPWIHKLVEEAFPGAKHLLDFFHLESKINLTFGKTSTGGTANQRDQAIKCVKNIDSFGLVSAIQNWNPPPEKQEDKRKLLKYIVNNLEQIDNHLGSNIHGSGMIEKGVDLMISRRLKMRAMGWTKDGSNVMLKFKVLQYNNHWDDYWKERKGYNLLA